MKKIIMIMLLVSFIFLPSSIFAQDLGKIAKANFSAAQGEALYNNSRYDEAIAPLENAITIRPEHGRAHYFLALTYEKMNKKDKAVGLLETYLGSVNQTSEWVGSEEAA